MKYVFHPEALIEFSEATIYYFQKSSKLGAAFYAEIETTIHQIVENPKLFRLIEEDIRCCFTRRFPYGILYTVEKNYVLIVAVMHYSREPFYWKHRIKKG